MDEKRVDHDPINDAAADWEGAGLPAQEDSTEEQALPRDEPSSMGEHGPVGTDTEAGEPLDSALSREQPEAEEAEDASAPPHGAPRHAPAGGEDRGMRLVEEDEGIREDREETLIAEDAGEDRGAYSPEEQAIHTEEETPGTA
ncbi:hypothetical protein F4561_003888 [Lipingzhangella halophila]|uniref:DUF5709 domain-containing protein n=1 Tax=Lipingzhangella halophila TaxID=1783352 RepID=A0A7W7RK74_9ACTN|nr:DUF5709 domain-containing protein [Lipingzhangella halophila]MBB4933068.1 hypothetical protein [Lipingzhangella halophila]